MKKTKISRWVLGFAVGWLFSSIVITPPLRAYEGWVTLVVITIALILALMDG